MPLIVKKIEKGNPGDPKAPKKWYLSLKRLSMAKSKEIAQIATKDTTLNPNEVEYSYSLSLGAIPGILKQGRSAQLGNLGTFNLTVSSEPADTKDGLTVRNIKKINIRFRPSQEFQDAVGDAEFVFSENI